jgi:hypothetical protein
MFTNFLAHPKTSIAGVLIAIGTVAGVLSQNGITLGHAGAGTIVTLVASLATALLGLVARDPGSVSASALDDPAHKPVSVDPDTSAQKLGVLMLCAILLGGSMPVMGCNGATVAQDIVNWTPALESAVQVVSATGSVLDPAATPIFEAATAGFEAGAGVLEAQAKAYLANPSATTLGHLQNAVVTLQQTVNASLLEAAKIVNPASQKKALADINAVAVVVTAMLALVSTISSKAAVARMSEQSQIKTAAVFAFIDTPDARRTVAAHYDVSADQARVMMEQSRVELQTAGL